MFDTEENVLKMTNVFNFGIKNRTKVCSDETDSMKLYQDTPHYQFSIIY